MSELPSASDKSVFNLSEALDRLGGDVGLLSEVTELFVQDSGVQLQLVRQAILTKDYSSAQILAHGMSSAARSVGAERLAEYWKALDLALRKHPTASEFPDGLVRIIANGTEEFIAIWRSQRVA